LPKPIGTKKAKKILQQEGADAYPNPSLLEIDAAQATTASSISAKDKRDAIRDTIKDEEKAC
jgi:hypothetical protein